MILFYPNSLFSFHFFFSQILTYIALEFIIPNGFTGLIKGIFIGNTSVFLQTTFPSLASCDFPHKEINDTVITTYKCILSHNVINQKVFAVVYILIAIYSVCCIIVFIEVIWTYFCKVIWARSLKAICIKFCKCKCGCKANNNFNKYLNEPIKSDHIFFQPGNFFVLNLIKANINEVVFAALLNGLISKWRTENAQSMDTDESIL